VRRVFLLSVHLTPVATLDIAVHCMSTHYNYTPYSVQAHGIFEQLHKMNLNDMHGKTIAKVSISHLMLHIRWQ